MPTNEAGLSEGHDLGAGGGITASDTPGPDPVPGRTPLGGAEGGTTDAAGPETDKGQGEADPEVDGVSPG